MNEATVPPPLPKKSVGLIVSASLFLTLLADFFLWPAKPGLSLGLYGLILVGPLLIFKHRPGNPTWLAGLLLLGTVVQAALGLNVWTWFWLVLLLIYATSLSYLQDMPGLWARWSEACWAWMKAPFRWFWLLEESLKKLPGSLGQGLGALWRGLSILIPTALLGLIFLVLLALGNVVMGHGIVEMLRSFFNWLWEDLTFSRLVFWIVAATLLLAILEPARMPSAQRFWNREVGAFSLPEHPNTAAWRSRAILLMVNLLFVVANSIDTWYLWARGVMPEGVTYSEYVHQGVYTLTAAVLFAALVLVGIFQQSPAITRRRGIRVLALLWIVQNLFLLFGVFLRLRLYVETYHLSVLRLGVMLFLGLVGTGFLILALYVLREKSFNWLLGRTTLAALALTFCVQFLDTSAVVASYNVRKWQENAQNESQALDVAYLASLGPSAWPWLKKVAEDPRNLPESASVRNFLETIVWSKDWRSWQWNEVRARRIMEPTPIRADLPVRMSMGQGAGSRE